MRPEAWSPFARWGVAAAALVVGLAATAVGLARRADSLESRVASLSGLTRAFYPTPDFRDPPLSLGPAASPDLSFLVDDPGLPRREFSVRWSGYWYVRGDGPFDLYTRADDRLEIFFGDRRVIVRDLADGQRTVRHTIRPGAGVHRVRIDYVQRGGPARLSLGWAPAGELQRPFGPGVFFLDRPSREVLETVDRAARLRSASRVLRAACLALLTGLLLAWALRTWRRFDLGSWAARCLTAIGSWARRPIGEIAGVALLAAVGGILRVEALVRAYGAVPLGSALETVQTSLAQAGPWLHGGRLVWREAAERTGDPVAYLNNARAMTWFYDGIAREPVFPYATKLWLQLTGDADVAVSAASTLFSVLCVPATYIVGRLAFGRAAGLAAAVVVAIEPELIRWGIQGWRDDAFTVFFLAFGAACLAFRARPSPATTALLAAGASLALLTRLTALSFVAPAFLLLTLEPAAASRRTIVRRLGAAAIGIALLVSPYLVNTWLRTGDPLTAVNRNTTFYRQRAGQDASGAMRADAYLLSLVRTHPVAMADTVLEGVTTYPFRNKFRALEVWSDALPGPLAALAVAGLLTWLWSADGRLLLTLLVCSLLPYAFTWQIRGGAEWRFTMHVYPLFLIAAGACLSMGAALAAKTMDGRILLAPQIPVRAGISLALAALLTAVLIWMPYPRFEEALAADGRASISAGWRDVVFFRRDWHPPVAEGGVTSRASRGPRARVWTPLAPGPAYRVTAVVAPAAGAGGEPVRLQARVDGHEMPAVLLSDRRFTEYHFDLGAGITRSNCCSIEFLANEASFRLRSIRVAAVGSGIAGAAAKTGEEQ